MRSARGRRTRWRGKGGTGHRGAVPLLESFFDPDGGLSPAFARAFESWMPWETNPIYAILHEAIYCQGAQSRWAAHRVRGEREFAAAFDAAGAAARGDPVNFTGEMVYPWMFEDFAALRPYKAAAEVLAAKSDWGQLYDTEALSSNAVPTAAALYLEDMYVDYALAQESAEHVRGLRIWATNEYKHSGIRDDGSRILDRLLGMARDMILLEYLSTEEVAAWAAMVDGGTRGGAATAALWARARADPASLSAAERAAAAAARAGRAKVGRLLALLAARQSLLRSQRRSVRTLGWLLGHASGRRGAGDEAEGPEWLGAELADAQARLAAEVAGGRGGGASGARAFRAAR
ncbi:proline iminopeptidase [Raphidocelis subcapitata]|uniref:Proline iminopeptidase n=1 Tax=Raphidocelis subcapitata TaxID=307507 RepID=A0A2V0PFN8_9CHLO|nr:proline iminopeptidase [Raphidocelis subcapitata]|eukprot:GBF98668.1 proline iminopeptidase [Raphidocelis subcapitata]